MTVAIPRLPRLEDFAPNSGGPWFLNKAGRLFTPQEVELRKARLQWHRELRACVAANDQARLGLNIIELPTRVDHGTAQTRHRMKQDIVVDLQAEGYLEPEHVTAAKEIEETLGSYFLPLRPKISRYGASFGNGGSTTQPVPGEHLTARQRDLWAVYVTWAAIVGKRYWVRWARPAPYHRENDAGPSCDLQPAMAMRHLELVVSIVVDNETLISITRRMKVRETSGVMVARTILRKSLALFCRERERALR